MATMFYYSILNTVLLYKYIYISLDSQFSIYCVQHI